MTHRLFGGDGVAEIIDFSTPSKRVKELFQEDFGDFGALATDVDAGLRIVDTDSLEVIVLDYSAIGIPLCLKSFGDITAVFNQSSCD